jgi:hypothetical protein
MKRMILTLCLPALLAVPTVAHAGIMDELDAADQVNRVAAHRFHIDPLATCRTIGSGRFTCKITDYKSSCLYSGRANVLKISRYTFRVTTMRVSKDCI